MKSTLVTISMLIGFVVSAAALTGQSGDRILLPMGGGNENLAADFITQVVPRVVGKSLHVLVLPIGYASNSEVIDLSERKANLETAELHRLEIERACQVIAPQGTTCTVSLAPVFVRSEAENFDLGEYNQPALTGVFILGGDQAIAMQVMQDTPLEKSLAQLYESGVVIGGSSAGAALQSKTMLAGYRDGYDQSNALDFGAVNLGSSSMRGVEFGVPGAIIDQHFFQRGRMGRLLNAIAMPGAPQIGIGLDAYTGVQIANYVKIDQVFGKYAVAILDAQSYHSADAVQYRGARQIISLRNVVIHLLAPGNFSYDITRRRISLAPLPLRIERSYESLVLPPRAGPLYLSGYLDGDLSASQVLNHFINLSGGANARLLVILAGFASVEHSTQVEQAYRQVLPAATTYVIVKDEIQEPIRIPARTSGLILVGEDQARLQISGLEPLKQAWLHGTPLMMVGGGIAIAGSYYSVHSPNPLDELTAEEGTERSLLLNKTKIAPGLALIEATFEPRLLENNRWGRWFSLAYTHPKQVAFGISDRAAIALTQTRAEALGENPILALDLRQARLDFGNNQAFVIANGLIDVFGPQDEIQPVTADVNAAPVRLATPLLPTGSPTMEPTATVLATQTKIASTATPTAGQTVQPTLTRTPRPTVTPLATPEPTDPRFLNAMILLSAVAVMIVLLGVWLNRERINLR